MLLCVVIRMDVEYDVSSLPRGEEMDRIVEALEFYRDQYDHIPRHTEVTTQRVGQSEVHRLKIRIGKIDCNGRTFLDYEFDLRDIRGAIIGTLHSFLTGLS